MKTKIVPKSMRVRRSISAPAKRPGFKNILVTTDFSPEAQAGPRWASALAGRLGASLTLLHVVQPPSRLSGADTAALTSRTREIEALARTHLSALAMREDSGMAGIATTVRTGIPFHEITAAASEQGADLIVMATHGQSGAGRIMTGSTAERVVRHASCSVLTVPARTAPKATGKPPPFKLKRILVPTDFSDFSKGALPLAVFLAGQFSAEVILFHVVEKFPIDYLLGRELTDKNLAPLVKKAGAGLELMAAGLTRTPPLKISVAVRTGTPHEEICRVAGTLEADLIVLTTHGYTGLKHVWLGSHAERVVRHAQCPVLIVRESAPSAIDLAAIGEQA